MYYENYKGAEFPRSYIEILMYLTKDENICEPSVIADSLCIPRQTMTSIIDSMVKQKLVKRIPHLSDRRRILIEITEKGREIVALTHKLFSGVDSAMLEGFSDEELSDFMGYLERIQSNIKKQMTNEREKNSEKMV
jgi:DNA-binding MarR family transcriptional regulator